MIFSACMIFLGSISILLSCQLMFRLIFLNKVSCKKEDISHRNLPAVLLHITGQATSFGLMFIVAGIAIYFPLLFLLNFLLIFFLPLSSSLIARSVYDVYKSRSDLEDL